METTTQIKPTITIDEYFQIVSKLSIKIGQITAAERIPKSNGLKLAVSFGSNPEDIKTAFTNLGKTFEPEAFVGKQFPFVMNLAPTEIKGVNSQVMIVVGEKEDGTIELGNFTNGSKLI